MSAQVQDSSVASRVLHRIKRRGVGRVFVPRDFLDLGSRRAVDVALHRLVATDKVRRLSRGIYDYPKQHPRFGLLTPPMDDLAQAVARRTGETLVCSGAMAANLLGLTTQVPARPIYLTDGTTRDVRVGNSTLRFRHAGPKRMQGGDTRAGLVLRALQLYGDAGIDEATMSHLRRTLSGSDRQQLRRLRPGVSAWLQSALDVIADDSPPSSGSETAQVA